MGGQMRLALPLLWAALAAAMPGRVDLGEALVPAKTAPVAATLAVPASAAAAQLPAEGATALAAAAPATTRPWRLSRRSSILPLHDSFILSSLASHL